MLSEQNAAPGEIIFDAGIADFEDRVIKASMEKPVLVDFWAPWCGPCKQLMPVLEAEVQAAGGDVLMAKINLDENQQLAQALRVQSVPTVFAFFQGQPIDAFQGVLPAGQIKAFIHKAVQAAAQTRPEAIDIPETLQAAANALAGGDLQGAQALYAQVLNQDDKNVASYVGLVKVLLAAGHIEEAANIVENAPEEVIKDASFAEAKTALELAQASPVGDLAELEAKVQASPKDHQARIDLAMAQFSAGAKEQAIDSLIESIGIDRTWNDEEARKQLLKLFEALGFADPLAVEGRKKLSSILFS